MTDDIRDHKMSYLTFHYPELVKRAVYDPVMRAGIESFISQNRSIDSVIMELVLAYSVRVDELQEELIESKRKELPGYRLKAGS